VVPTYLDNPEFWRARADEARLQAEQMRDHDAKQALLKFADVYERHAMDAEASIKARKRSGGAPARLSFCPMLGHEFAMTDFDRSGFQVFGNVVVIPRHQ
jgi:hypothetical protein